MAQLYTTGPVWLFVAVPGGTLSFLGFGEEAPTIEILPRQRNVRSDASGEVPFDKSFQGKEATTSVVLNYHNKTILEACESIPYETGRTTSGSYSARDMGTLMLTEGRALSLYVLFSNQGDPTMPGMPGGYRFPNNTAIDGPIVKKPGSHEEKISLVFRSVPIFNPNDKSFTLYDYDVAVAQNLPLV